MTSVGLLLLLLQERLLLSVLPRHVATEMMSDLETASPGNNSAVGAFRKMYMSRYENVRYVCACV